MTNKSREYVTKTGRHVLADKNGVPPWPFDHAEKHRQAALKSRGGKNVRVVTRSKLVSKPVPKHAPKSSSKSAHNLYQDEVQVRMPVKASDFREGVPAFYKKNRNGISEADRLMRETLDNMIAIGHLKKGSPPAGHNAPTRPEGNSTLDNQLATTSNDYNQLIQKRNNLDKKLRGLGLRLNRLDKNSNEYRYVVEQIRETRDAINELTKNISQLRENVTSTVSKTTRRKR